MHCCGFIVLYEMCIKRVLQNGRKQHELSSSGCGRHNALPISLTGAQLLRRAPVAKRRKNSATVQVSHYYDDLFLVYVRANLIVSSGRFHGCSKNRSYVAGVLVCKSETN